MSNVPVLVSQRVERPQQEPYERRVTAAGVYEECSAVRAEFVDGEMRFIEQPLEWRRRAQLAPPELAELEQAIRAARFSTLAGEHRPSGGAIGGSIVTWTATIDGATYEVVLVNAPIVRIEVLEDLGRNFDRLTTLAMDRERAAASGPNEAG